MAQTVNFTLYIFYHNKKILMPGLQPKVFSLTWHKMQWGHQNFRSSLYDSNLKNLRNTVLYQGFSASQTFSSVAQLCLALCNPMDCSMPGFLVLHQLPELAQTHVHRVSDDTQPSGSLLLLPSIFPSIGVFSKESDLCIRWPKYSGLTSFRIHWFDLLAVQGTLKSLFQHCSSKKHLFFGTQLSLCSNSHIHT